MECQVALIGKALLTVLTCQIHTTRCVDYLSSTTIPTIITIIRGVKHVNDFHEVGVFLAVDAVHLLADFFHQGWHTVFEARLFFRGGVRVEADVDHFPAVVGEQFVVPIFLILLVVVSVGELVDFDGEDGVFQTHVIVDATSSRMGQSQVPTV